MSDIDDVKELLSCMDEPITAVNLRRIFLLLMRVHWSDSDHFGSIGQHLTCDQYNYADPRDGLKVDLVETFDPENTSTSPGVYVGLKKGIKYKKKVVADFVEHSDDRARTDAVKEAQTLLVISHVNASADQALAMGEIDVTFLFGVRPALMQRMNIRGFDILTLTDPLKIDEAPNRDYQVDVVASLTFDLSVTTNIESHRIKKIATMLNQQ